jgi:hypothetical protein
MWRNLLVAVAGAGGAQPWLDAALDAAMDGEGGAGSCLAGAQALRQSRTSNRDATEEETTFDSMFHAA